MNLNDMISKLQPLGIAGREAEVYMAMLKNSALTASEISKITTVSINKIYEVLQSLVKKKMCTENYLNGVKLFRCIEPKIAFKNFFSIYEEEISRKKNMYGELEETLTDIYRMKKNSKSPLDYIEVVSDRGQAIDRFMNIQANAEKEILFFTKPPYTDKLGANLDKIKSVCNNNVKVKSIYETCNNENGESGENFIKITELYRNMGEDVRIIRELPMKLVIFDESITIMSLVDNVTFNSELTTLIVHHPIFALSQKTLFEVYWKKAITIEEYKSKYEEFEPNTITF
jgi:HTH-type transcriptional regulator, sugar sensing transcriptional regulator